MPEEFLLLSGDASDQVTRAVRHLEHGYVFSQQAPAVRRSIIPFQFRRVKLTGNFGSDHTANAVRLVYDDGDFAETGDEFAVEDRGGAFGSGEGNGDEVWCIQPHDRNAWEVLAGRTVLRFAKAAADWEENSGDYRVSCRDCSRDGTLSNPSQTPYYVYLPAQRASSAAREPAVYSNDVIVYAVDSSGDRVCVGDYMDHARGWIESWNGGSDHIPRGWTLCDGVSVGGVSVPDLRARFLMCINTAGGARSDEDTTGDTGGHRWHGTTDNNHPNHEDHKHDILYNTFKAAADPFTGTDVVLPAAVPWLTHDMVAPGLDPVKHLGPENTAADLGDTDNRPPYYVLAFIMRVK